MSPRLGARNKKTFTNTTDITPMPETRRCHLSVNVLMSVVNGEHKPNPWLTREEESQDGTKKYVCDHCGESLKRHKEVTAQNAKPEAGTEHQKFKQQYWREQANPWEKELNKIERALDRHASNFSADASYAAEKNGLLVAVAEKVRDGKLPEWTKGTVTYLLWGTSDTDKLYGARCIVDGDWKKYTAWHNFFLAKSSNTLKSLIIEHEGAALTSGRLFLPPPLSEYEGSSGAVIENNRQAAQTTGLGEVILASGAPSPAGAFGDPDMRAASKTMPVGGFAMSGQGTPAANVALPNGTHVVGAEPWFPVQTNGDGQPAVDMKVVADAYRRMEDKIAQFETVTKMRSAPEGPRYNSNYNRAYRSYNQHPHGYYNQHQYQHQHQHHHYHQPHGHHSATGPYQHQQPMMRDQGGRLGDQAYAPPIHHLHHHQAQHLGPQAGEGEHDEIEGSHGFHDTETMLGMQRPLDAEAQPPVPVADHLALPVKQKPAPKPTPKGGTKKVQ